MNMSNNIYSCFKKGNCNQYLFKTNENTAIKLELFVIECRTVVGPKVSV